MPPAESRGRQKRICRTQGRKSEDTIHNTDAESGGGQNRQYRRRGGRSGQRSGVERGGKQSGRRPGGRRTRTERGGRMPPAESRGRQKRICRTQGRKSEDTIPPQKGCGRQKNERDGGTGRCVPRAVPICGPTPANRPSVREVPEKAFRSAEAVRRQPSRFGAEGVETAALRHRTHPANDRFRAVLQTLRTNMITKAEIRQVRALADKRGRTETGLFVAEGEKLVGELRTSHLRVERIYALEGSFS